jgi:hypothetical protein
MNKKTLDKLLRLRGQQFDRYMIHHRTLRNCMRLLGLVVVEFHALLYTS